MPGGAARAFRAYKMHFGGWIMQGEHRMRTHWVAALAAVSLFLGVGLGIAASQHGGGIDVIRGKSAKDAGAAALAGATSRIGRS